MYVFFGPVDINWFTIEIYFCFAFEFQKNAVKLSRISDKFIGNSRSFHLVFVSFGKLQT